MASRTVPRHDLLALVREPVLHALSEHAHTRGVRLFLVGGPVRDLMSGRNPSDLDIASAATPQRFRDIMADFSHPGATVTVFDVGESHGTTGVHVVTAGKVLDIEHTTFRADSYSPRSRTPAVTLIEDLVEDLARRDFTVNAMALDLVDGTVWDPFNGAEDLRAHRLRCPGDPVRTFADDPLRVNRMVRFAAVRGLEPDRRTRAAAQLARHAMSSLSAERVAAELERIIAAPGALARAAALCAQLELGPQVLNVDNPEAVAAAAGTLNTADELRTLLALVSGDPETFLERMRADRSTRRATLAVTGLLTHPGPLAMRVRAVGPDCARTAASVAVAVGHRAADELERLAGLTELFAPLAITGDDIVAAGRSGPDVGRALVAATAALVQAAVEHRPAPTRDEQLAAALTT